MSGSQSPVQTDQEGNVLLVDRRSHSPSDEIPYRPLRPTYIDIKDQSTVKSKAEGSASFLRAARAGNLEKVLEFLKSGTDINTCNANGLNALHLASKEGHSTVVRELLKRGANVDASTKKGNTALHIASLAGQDEIVHILIDNKANVNVQSQNGFTPLYMAAQENHDAVVTYLLQHGANQSLATEDGFTPLAVALQQGHDRVVALLLENDTRGKVRLPALHIAAKKDDTKAASLLLQNEHNPDVTSKSGFTPLHIAAHYGNESVANMLLEKGANVNYQARHNITPLHVAAKWGRANLVTLLVGRGAVIDSKTRDLLTPLHCAARSGHDGVVDLLLEKGAPITAHTKNGLSPLHMAAQGDHCDTARILIHHRALVDDVTVDYLTPLHVASHCGHVRVAKLLLDRGADPNSRALNGFTPLHIACKKNRIKVVELLLKYNAKIEATTESGLTPLHVASFMGCMNIVIFLIQNGAHVDDTTVRCETPLHLAARANQTDIIRILLRNGATVDARAREQQTPLHIASRLGNTDIVMLLLQSGAQPDAATRDQYTPLHIAAKEGQEEVVAILLDHNATMAPITKKGFTPLHLAAKYGNINVAKLLLDRGSEVDIQGKNQVTPLHVASHYDHQNVALLLLDRGASPHAAAKNGYTPLHIAAKKNQMDIATTLIDYGANTNCESKAGFTPLHLAGQEGHVQMVHLLMEHAAHVNARAKNGLTPMHLCAQENRVPVAQAFYDNGGEIDPTTKAGYTPLHVACHFGQADMVRFLLEHGADVNSTTKQGYTPLHQAAQQGHAIIVKTLLENGASPNAVTSQGQTPLAIAQRLGYVSVVETLRTVTETTVITETTMVTEERYKVQAPETMQETFISDSEDEGGARDRSGSTALFADHRYLTLSPEPDVSGGAFSSMLDFGGGYNGHGGPLAAPVSPHSANTLYHENGYHEHDIPQSHHRLSVSTPGSRWTEFFRETLRGFEELSTRANSFDLSLDTTAGGLLHREDPRTRMLCKSEDTGLADHGFGEDLKGFQDQDDSLPMDRSITEDQMQLQTLIHKAEVQPLTSSVAEDSYRFEGSYLPDNVELSRAVHTGFLISFMVDARGGAMRGCRHSGVRMIIPPRKCAMPMRITCRYLRKDKLVHPPLLNEGEGLASRVLEMGPAGAKFLGPVILEVPHFASLRGREREIMILRSDDGEHWKEHLLEATEDAVQEVLNQSFSPEELCQLEDLQTTRITRILTNDFPQYFAIVTRIRQEVHAVGPEGGMISSTVVPQVQAIFPEGALTKTIKVSLQAQHVSHEIVTRLQGNRVAVSPIVTVEPRRRKFHKPITLTIPLPQTSSKSMITLTSGGHTQESPPTLRLLCSITGGTALAQWEDITGTTQLNFTNENVSFTTTVSARFWLMDCQTPRESAKMAQEIYNESIYVPYMAKFVVFGRRTNDAEAQLRVFCMTDDKEDKTLEKQEHFSEIAKSRDVEVLAHKQQYIEFGGNLTAVTKSGDQLSLNFVPFQENRLPFVVRLRDRDDPSTSGRIAFMRDMRPRADALPPQHPICTLNVQLPEGRPYDDVSTTSSHDLLSLERKYNQLKGPGIESLHKADVKLSDIARELNGDWPRLARTLDIPESDIVQIQQEYPGQEAMVTLRIWFERAGKSATGNALERALRKIGRDDIVKKNIFNVEKITTDTDRRAAKEQLYEAEKPLPPLTTAAQRLKGKVESPRRDESMDVSYDEADMKKADQMPVVQEAMLLNETPLPLAVVHQNDISQRVFDYEESVLEVVQIEQQEQEPEEAEPVELSPVLEHPEQEVPPSPEPVLLSRAIDDYESVDALPSQLHVSRATAVDLHHSSSYSDVPPSIGRMKRRSKGDSIGHCDSDDETDSKTPDVFSRRHSGPYDSIRSIRPSTIATPTERDTEHITVTSTEKLMSSVRNYDHGYELPQSVAKETNLMRQNDLYEEIVHEVGSPAAKHLTKDTTATVHIYDVIGDHHVPISTLCYSSEHGFAPLPLVVEPQPQLLSKTPTGLAATLTEVATVSEPPKQRSVTFADELAQDPDACIVTTAKSTTKYVVSAEVLNYEGGAESGFTGLLSVDAASQSNLSGSSMTSSTDDPRDITTVVTMTKFYRPPELLHAADGQQDSWPRSISPKWDEFCEIATLPVPANTVDHSPQPPYSCAGDSSASLYSEIEDKENAVLRTKVIAAPGAQPVVVAEAAAPPKKGFMSKLRAPTEHNIKKQQKKQQQSSIEQEQHAEVDWGIHGAVATASNSSPVVVQQQETTVVVSSGVGCCIFDDSGIGEEILARNLSSSVSVSSSVEAEDEPKITAKEQGPEGVLHSFDVAAAALKTDAIMTREPVSSGSLDLKESFESSAGSGSEVSGETIIQLEGKDQGFFEKFSQKLRRGRSLTRAQLKLQLMEKRRGDSVTDVRGPLAGATASDQLALKKPPENRLSSQATDAIHFIDSNISIERISPRFSLEDAVICYVINDPGFDPLNCEVLREASAWFDALLVAGRNNADAALNPCLTMPLRRMAYTFAKIDKHGDVSSQTRKLISDTDDPERIVKLREAIQAAVIVPPPTVLNAWAPPPESQDVDAGYSNEVGAETNEGASSPTSENYTPLRVSFEVVTRGDEEQQPTLRASKAQHSVSFMPAPEYVPSSVTPERPISPSKGGQRSGTMSPEPEPQQLEEDTVSRTIKLQNAYFERAAVGKKLKEKAWIGESATVNPLLENLQEDIRAKTSGNVAKALQSIVENIRELYIEAPDLSVIQEETENEATMELPVLKPATEIVEQKPPKPAAVPYTNGFQSSPSPEQKQDSSAIKNQTLLAPVSPSKAKESCHLSAGEVELTAKTKTVAAVATTAAAKPPQLPPKPCLIPTASVAPVKTSQNPSKAPASGLLQQLEQLVLPESKPQTISESEEPEFCFATAVAAPSIHCVEPHLKAVVVEGGHLLTQAPPTLNTVQSSSRDSERQPVKHGHVEEKAEFQFANVASKPRVTTCVATPSIAPTYNQGLVFSDLAIEDLEGSLHVAQLSPQPHVYAYAAPPPKTNFVPVVPPKPNKHSKGQPHSEDPQLSNTAQHLASLCLGSAIEELQIKDPNPKPVSVQIAAPVVPPRLKGSGADRDRRKSLIRQEQVSSVDSSDPENAVMLKNAGLKSESSIDSECSSIASLQPHQLKQPQDVVFGFSETEPAVFAADVSPSAGENNDRQFLARVGLFRHPKTAQHIPRSATAAVEVPLEDVATPPSTPLQEELRSVPLTRTTQQHEQREDGLLDEEGNVIVQKRITRVVTTTRTIPEGAEKPGHDFSAQRDSFEHDREEFHGIPPGKQLEQPAETEATARVERFHEILEKHPSPLSPHPSELSSNADQEISPVEEYSPVLAEPLPRIPVGESPSEELGRTVLEEEGARLSPGYRGSYQEEVIESAKTSAVEEHEAEEAPISVSARIRQYEQIVASNGHGAIPIAVKRTSVSSVSSVTRRTSSESQESVRSIVSNTPRSPTLEAHIAELKQVVSSVPEAESVYVAEAEVGPALPDAELELSTRVTSEPPLREDGIVTLQEIVAPVSEKSPVSPEIAEAVYLAESTTEYREEAESPEAKLESPELEQKEESYSAETTPPESLVRTAQEEEEVVAQRESPEQEVIEAEEHEAVYAGQQKELVEKELPESPHEALSSSEVLTEEKLRVSEEVQRESPVVGEKVEEALTEPAEEKGFFIETEDMQISADKAVIQAPESPAASEKQIQLHESKKLSLSTASDELETSEDKSGQEQIDVKQFIAESPCIIERSPRKTETPSEFSFEPKPTVLEEELYVEPQHTTETITKLEEIELQRGSSEDLQKPEFTRHISREEFFVAELGESTTPVEATESLETDGFKSHFVVESEPVESQPQLHTEGFDEHLEQDGVTLSVEQLSLDEERSKLPQSPPATPEPYTDAEAAIPERKRQPSIVEIQERIQLEFQEQEQEQIEEERHLSDEEEQQQKSNESMVEEHALTPSSASPISPAKSVFVEEIQAASEFDVMSSDTESMQRREAFGYQPLREDSNEKITTVHSAVLKHETLLTSEYRTHGISSSEFTSHESDSSEAGGAIHPQHYYQQFDEYANQISPTAEDVQEQFKAEKPEVVEEPQHSLEEAEEKAAQEQDTMVEKAATLEPLPQQATPTSEEEESPLSEAQVEEMESRLEPESYENEGFEAEEAEPEIVVPPSPKAEALTSVERVEVSYEPPVREKLEYREKVEDIESPTDVVIIQRYQPSASVKIEQEPVTELVSGYGTEANEQATQDQEVKETVLSPIILEPVARSESRESTASEKVYNEERGLEYEHETREEPYPVLELAPEEAEEEHISDEESRLLEKYDEFADVVAAEIHECVFELLAQMLREETMQAAAKIQAGVRGFLTRKHFQRKRPTSLDATDYGRPAALEVLHVDLESDMMKPPESPIAINAPVEPEDDSYKRSSLLFESEESSSGGPAMEQLLHVETERDYMKMSESLDLTAVAGEQQRLPDTEMDLVKRAESVDETSAAFLEHDLTTSEDGGDRRESLDHIVSGSPESPLPEEGFQILEQQPEERPEEYTEREQFELHEQEMGFEYFADEAATKIQVSARGSLDRRLLGVLTSTVSDSMDTQADDEASTEPGEPIVLASPSTQDRMFSASLLPAEESAIKEVPEFSQEHATERQSPTLTATETSEAKLLEKGVATKDVYSKAADVAPVLEHHDPSEEPFEPGHEIPFEEEKPEEELDEPIAELAQTEAKISSQFVCSTRGVRRFTESAVPGSVFEHKTVETAAAAASKIQASVRGFLTRRHLLRAMSVESQLRQPPQIQLTPDEEDVAATKIQAVVKGFLVRQHIREQQKCRSSTEPLSEEELVSLVMPLQRRASEGDEFQAPPADHAAAVIQAGVRGYLVRREVKRQLEAIKKIQAGVRGYHVRKHVSDIRSRMSTPERPASVEFLPSDSGRQQFYEQQHGPQFPEEDTSPRLEERTVLSEQDSISSEELVEKGELEDSRQLYSSFDSSRPKMSTVMPPAFEGISETEEVGTPSEDEDTARDDLHQKLGKAKSLNIGHLCQEPAWEAPLEESNVELEETSSLDQESSCVTVILEERSLDSKEGGTREVETIDVRFESPSSCVSDDASVCIRESDSGEAYFLADTGGGGKRSSTEYETASTDQYETAVSSQGTDFYSVTEGSRTFSSHSTSSVGGRLSGFAITSDEEEDFGGIGEVEVGKMYQLETPDSSSVSGEKTPRAETPTETEIAEAAVATPSPDLSPTSSSILGYRTNIPQHLESSDVPKQSPVQSDRSFIFEEGVAEDKRPLHEEQPPGSDGGEPELEEILEVSESSKEASSPGDRSPEEPAEQYDQNIELSQFTNRPYLRGMQMQPSVDIEIDVDSPSIRFSSPDTEKQEESEGSFDRGQEPEYSVQTLGLGVEERIARPTSPLPPRSDSEQRIAANTRRSSGKESPLAMSGYGSESPQAFSPIAMTISPDLLNKESSESAESTEPLAETECTPDDADNEDADATSHSIRLISELPRDGQSLDELSDLRKADSSEGLLKSVSEEFHTTTTTESSETASDSATVVERKYEMSSVVMSESGEHVLVTTTEQITISGSGAPLQLSKLLQDISPPPHIEDRLELLATTATSVAEISDLPPLMSPSAASESSEIFRTFKKSASAESISIKSDDSRSEKSSERQAYASKRYSSSRRSSNASRKSSHDESPTFSERLTPDLQVSWTAETATRKSSNGVASAASREEQLEDASQILEKEKASVSSSSPGLSPRDNVSPRPQPAEDSPTVESILSSADFADEFQKSQLRLQQQHEQQEDEETAALASFVSSYSAEESPEEPMVIESELETVPEEPEYEDDQHMRASLDSLKRTLRVVESDNASEASLQEFERLEMAIGSGDRSLSGSEVELFIQGKRRISNGGSNSSLAEFERLEREIEVTEGGVSSTAAEVGGITSEEHPLPDVMLLSDIHEESEPEDMSTKGDEFIASDGEEHGIGIADENIDWPTDLGYVPSYEELQSQIQDRKTPTADTPTSASTGGSAFHFVEQSSQQQQQHVISGASDQLQQSLEQLTDAQDQQLADDAKSDHESDHRMSETDSLDGFEHVAVEECQESPQAPVMSYPAAERGIMERSVDSLEARHQSAETAMSRSADSLELQVQQQFELERSADKDSFEDLGAEQKQLEETHEHDRDSLQDVEIVESQAEIILEQDTAASRSSKDRSSRHSSRHDSLEDVQVTTDSAFLVKRDSLEEAETERHVTFEQEEIEQVQQIYSAAQQQTTSTSDAALAADLYQSSFKDPGADIGDKDSVLASSIGTSGGDEYASALLSQETHGLLSGETMQTFQEYGEDHDRDSLTGDIDDVLEQQQRVRFPDEEPKTPVAEAPSAAVDDQGNVFDPYSRFRQSESATDGVQGQVSSGGGADFPSTQTTFETCQTMDDGSLEVITRTTTTRVLDPLEHRVRFGSADSETQLERYIRELQDHNADYEEFESVDELGNVTKTVIRRVRLSSSGLAPPELGTELVAPPAPDTLGPLKVDTTLMRHSETGGSLSSADDSSLQQSHAFAQSSGSGSPSSEQFSAGKAHVLSPSVVAPMGRTEQGSVVLGYSSHLSPSAGEGSSEIAEPSSVPGFPTSQSSSHPGSS